MNNKTNTFLSIIFLLPVFLISSLSAKADIVSGSHWLVKSGDSVYGIARNVFPDDKNMQARFRKELVKTNPDIFKNNANLMSVGSKLKLPAFAIKKPQLKPEPVAQPKPEKKKAIRQPVVVKKVQPKSENIIGKVVINLGELRAENSGQTRQLKRNSKILKGDTIKTAKRTYTQIRLEDGALLSLRPETEFHIAEFNYNGKQDGTERGIFELIKGGFRTITGAIGHRNKQNYKVKTAVATIGIRGTHYGLMLCSAGSCQNNDSDNLSDGLYGGVVDGSVMINNKSGQHSFNNDQYFHLASINKAPVEQLKPPPIFHGQADRPAQKDQKQPGQGPRPRQMSGQPKQPIKHIPGNTGFMPPPPDETKPPLINTSDDGTQTFTQPVAQNQAPNGASALIAFSHIDTTSLAQGASSPITITPTNNNYLFLGLLPSQSVDFPFAGHMEEWSPELQRFIKYDLRIDPAQFSTNMVSGRHATLDVTWGRWNAPFYAAKEGDPVSQNPTPTNNNLHIIYSPNLTSPFALAQLGGLGSNVQYTVTGNTLPTDNTGATGTLTGINMSVDFVGQQITNYNVSVNVNSSNYFARSIGNIAFTDLNRNFRIDEQSPSTTICMSGNCVGEASVAFVGNQAGGAMTTFSIAEPDGSSSVSGAALLENGM